MSQLPPVPWSPELRVFADTSSLMEPGARACFDGLTPLLSQHGLRLIVPEKVMGELRRMTGPREALAAEGLKIIQRLYSQGLIEIRGESDDSYVDNLFQAVFVRFRLRYDLVLLTQDRALAQDILGLNDANAVQRIRGIYALRVTSRGLSPWRAEMGESSGSQRGGRRPAGSSGAARPAPPRLPQTWPLVPLTTTLEPVRTPPGVGDTVVGTDGRRHRLQKVLGTGGEGAAYETDTGLVCKVFAADRCYRSRLDKIELMASNPVGHRAICWPATVVTSGSARVGYLMPKAHGREVQKSIFVKPLLLKYFPGWTKENLVQLAISVLEPIAHLNSHGILLGDINPRNILVASDRQVFLVDTDSYQFRGYPCRVGMPPFLAPELYGADLSSTLRTDEHEAFAVSTLVFMLMLPGKPPYSHQGGEDPAKNVKKGKFPYAVGEKKGTDVPEGPWRYQFSHLPRYMKEEFNRAFSKGARIGAAEWLDTLARYRNDLAAGFVSNELFPTGLKELTREQTERAGGEWVRCHECNREFGHFGDHPRPMCRQCLQALRERRDARDASPRAAASSHAPRSRPQPRPQPAPQPGPSQSPPPPRNPRPGQAQPDDPFTAMVTWFLNLFN